MTIENSKQPETIDGKPRCAWANLKNPLYLSYHDEEWGVPCHDEIRLFEMLNLEGAQAGLSWETILNKRENYRAAFDGWDPPSLPATTRASGNACWRTPASCATA